MYIQGSALDVVLSYTRVQTSQSGTLENNYYLVEDTGLTDAGVKGSGRAVPRGTLKPQFMP